MDQSEDRKQSAADAEGGQEQEPKQAQEDSSSFWDTEQHSDAPGPFGTGSDMEKSAAAGEEPEEPEEDEGPDAA